MGIWTTQSNFTKGELDPTLLGRTDLDTFYQGVQTATNVLSIPQGGLKKRPGTLYQATALGDGRLENFSFNTEQNYLLAFTVNNMRVYKAGVLQATVTIPYTTITQIRDFDFIQSADTIIITHEDFAPQIIQRTSDTAWTVGAVPLTNLPQYDFNDASSPTAVAEVQDINFASENFGDRYKISLNGVLTDEIVFGASDATNRTDIATALLDLPNTGNTGISVSTVSTLDTYRVTLGGDSADNWDLMTVTPISVKNTGFEVVSSTVTNGTSAKEDVWSATRGWPRTCTFHEARLWFGGSSSRPSTLWGSTVNDLFNFNAGRARDDQGIDVTLATDQVNSINGIISNRSLQVFTSGAEFYVPASPITPENVAVKPQTNLGSKRVRPIVIDGLTMFIQRTGKALYQFQYIDEFQSNESRSTSLAAPHLIADPYQLVVSQGSGESDANYVYLISSSGDMTVFNTQSFEGVQAFTRWSCEGSINSAAVVDEDLYLLVNRDGTYYIDKADSTLNTDSAISQTITATDAVTGLTHLNGETVKVKAVGAAQLDKVVSGGAITLDRVVTGTVEVGLEYQPIIKTMPLNINLNDGSHAAQKKRILRCAIRVYESNGVIVNGQRLADKTIGENQFDAPTPQSEFKRVFLSGWSLEATIEITQTTPFPLTVLALDLEVKV
tara:strand:+ start:2395 stop:4398 length:2004 start_codon:yes stop_codon:yes gene_type:complete